MSAPQGECAVKGCRHWADAGIDLSVDKGLVTVSLPLCQPHAQYLALYWGDERYRHRFRVMEGK